MPTLVPRDGSPLAGEFLFNGEENGMLSFTEEGEYDFLISRENVLAVVFKD